LTSAIRRWRASVGLLAFAALALVEVAWVVGVPVGVNPDEPAHVYRAVSVWQGDLLPRADAQGRQWVIRVPAATVRAVNASICTRFRSDISNACAKASHGPGTGEVWAPSAAARYLPVYYAAVGWPTQFVSGRHAVYAIRLLSGLGCAALLAAAVSTTLRLRRPRLAAIGIAATITPMVTGVAAWVNPSAWEISGGILLWASLLALAGGRSTESRAALLSKIAVGGAALLLTRQISVVWAVLIFASIGLVLGVSACLAVIRRALRDRASRVVAGVLVVAAVGEQGWYLSAGKLFGDGPTPGRLSLAEVVMQSSLRVPLWLHQGYGVLGWLDASSPLLALAVWLAVVGLLILLAVLGSRRSLRWSVGFTLVMACAVSIAVESVFWNSIGSHWWQGRYTIPYAAGLPLLCAAIGSAAWRWDDKIGQALARWTVLPLAGASVLTYLAVVHRYGAGINHTLWPPGWSWQPPGTVYLVALCYVAGTALLVVVILRACVGEAESSCGVGVLSWAEGGPLSRLRPATGAARPTPDADVPGQTNTSGADTSQ
jgi:hypothetical protein